ncbi:DMT family transporter [Promethearchaeum syntrophicum]|uniref:DMT family transporter n=1 Tax=Promethearchaeum syntrophicum TaxID=2594042 RepID=A0A5B9DAW9_9ARCH|nr:DMT family transporter [Candidatus Prometheoarchaeum syntrophicum]QEE16252.1 EamA-like transporter family protein [Candidatus Prometheoarchaeum syntrophicum]
MQGWILAFLAVLTFVSSNIIFRRVEGEVSPTYINAVRTFIGIITFWIVAAISGVFPLIFQFPIILWVWLILSFIFGQVVGDTAYFMAQKELGVTQTIAIALTFPLFTYILSIIFLDDEFNYIIIISFIFISIGVILINSGVRNAKNIASNLEINKYTENEQNKKSWRAILLAFIASIAWAIGLVIIDYSVNEITIITGVQETSSVLANVVRFPFAFIILMGMVKHSDGKISVKKSKRAWGWLLIGSIIGTSLGAYLYTEAARTAGATIMSLFSTAAPLIAIPLDYIFNNEKISWRSLIGVVFITIGIAFVIFMTP